MNDKTAPIKNVLNVYWAHTKRYPVVLAVAVSSVIGVRAVEVAVPLFLKKLLDIVGGSAVASDKAVAALIGILISIALLSTLGWVLRRLGNFCAIRLQARTMADLAGSAFAYLIGHSYDFFVHNFAGSLVRRVGRLARSYEDFSDQVYYNILPLTFSTIGILAVLFYRHAFLGWALLLWLVVFLAIQFFLANWKQKYNVRKAAKDTEQTGVLADIISNETNVKLFSGFAAEDGRFKKVTSELRRANMLSWNIDEAINAATGALMVAIEFILMFGAIKLWQKGLITVGDFALIQVYLLELFDRLFNVGNAMRRLYDSFADAGEVVAIMEKPYEVADRHRATELTVPHGGIVFRNVIFHFKKTRRVLDALSLSIAPREKIALVGPSGAGKSTIVKLLLRFYDIDSGLIAIDGHNIAHVTQESLRDAIAVVPQDPILFHRTLMDNIRYGKRDATDDQVIEAAKQAHCHEFVEKFPEGYATFVGERGVRLSGGERQRIAIARAILKNAPILVLDEATSSLDSESERLIQDALVTLMKGKTVIVIAHRLSTIRSMDRIVVMEDGMVVTSGTHEELLSQGGLYARLWDIQAGGFLTQGEGAVFLGPRSEGEAEGTEASSPIFSEKESGKTPPKHTDFV